MSIRRRIWALPAISTLIFGVGLGISASFTASALTSITNTGVVNYPLLEKSKAIYDEVEGVINDLKTAVAEGEEKRIGQAEERAARIRKDIAALRAVPGQQQRADQLLADFDSYWTPAKAAAQILLGKPGDVQSTIAEMRTTLKKLEYDLNRTKSEAEVQFSLGINRSHDGVQRALTASIVSALAVIIGLVSIAALIIRSVWRQLGGEPEYAQRIATAVASGDLSMEITLQKGDEGSLLAAIKQMKDRLETMIGNIKGSAETIRLASTEISIGNADLSHRTEIQAQSLEQTASSMHDLNMTVRANVEQARQASDMAVSAAGIAGKGGAAVRELITTMSAINQSAQKITDIIGVIDNIAFRTNLLALNAAVEASHAGGQGKGFAIVATEVRELAQQCTDAAREIKMLIETSVSRVNAGSEVVSQTGDAMVEIVRSINQVSSIMISISEAGQEQGAGIEVVSVAMEQMDKTTQENTLLVEEAASAAKSLEEQAAALHRALDIFRVRAEQHA